MIMSKEQDGCSKIEMGVYTKLCAFVISVQHRLALDSTLLGYFALFFDWHGLAGMVEPVVAAGRGGASRDVMLVVSMRLKEVGLLLLPSLCPCLAPTWSASLRPRSCVRHLAYCAFLIGMLDLGVVLEVRVARMRRRAVLVEASCLGSIDLRLSCVILGQIVQL